MHKFARVVSALLLAGTVLTLAPPPADAYLIKPIWYSNSDGQTKRYIWNYTNNSCGPSLSHTSGIAVKLGTVYSDRMYVEWIEYKMIASAGSSEKYIINSNIDIQDTYGVYGYQSFATMWSGTTYRRYINRWFYDRNNTGISFYLTDHQHEACWYENTLWVDLRA